MKIDDFGGRFLFKVVDAYKEYLCMAALVNPNASWRERTGLCFTLFAYGYGVSDVWDIIKKKARWKNINSEITTSEIDKIYKYWNRNNIQKEAGHTSPPSSNFSSASFSIDDYFKTFIPIIIKKEKIPSSCLMAALYHHSVGRHPIPRSFDKKPAIKWKEFQDRQPTKEEILSWDWSNGIILLGTDRDCFLDVDEKGIESLMKYKDVLLNGNHWEKTPHGYHVFGRGNLKTKLKRGVVEIRGKGAYVVTYPTEQYTINR